MRTVALVLIPLFLPTYVVQKRKFRSHKEERCKEFKGPLPTWSYFVFFVLVEKKKAFVTFKAVYIRQNNNPTLGPTENSLSLELRSYRLIYGMLQRACVEGKHFV